MVEVQEPQPDWHAEAEERRQMARAAIRVAFRHGATDQEIADEYDVVRELEAQYGLRKVPRV